MEAIAYIRTQILQCSQQQLADALGVSQSHISRCERGESSPTLAEVARLRKMVRDLGVAWHDSWFFEPPALPPPKPDRLKAAIIAA